MKKLFAFFLASILLFSCAMCATVAYLYRDMLCAVEQDGASAPASIAFLYAIPFLVVIVASSIGAAIFFKKRERRE